MLFRSTGVKIATWETDYGACGGSSGRPVRRFAAMLQAGDDGGWTRVEVVKESKRWVGNLLGGGFGENAYKLNVSSTKGATGHALGGAGGIEGVILAKSICDGIIPPTANYENPDPECDLNYTPNQAIERDVRFGMSSSLGFGGHNAVIAMKKYNK